MDDSGIARTSVGDKLIAARTNACMSGNVRGAQVAQRRIEKRAVIRHAASRRHKQRKHALREYITDLNRRNHTPDPPCGDEGAGRA